MRGQADWISSLLLPTPRKFVGWHRGHERPMKQTERDKKNHWRDGTYYQILFWVIVRFLCIYFDRRMMKTRQMLIKEKHYPGKITLLFSPDSFLFAGPNVVQRKRTSVNGQCFMASSKSWLTSLWSEKNNQAEISTITESLYFFVISVFTERRRKTVRQMRLISATATMKGFVQLVPACAACACMCSCAYVSHVLV